MVITGSPRKKGNTMAMAEAFIKEAEAKGHEVYRLMRPRLIWAAVMPASNATRMGRLVPLMMISIRWLQRFWKRMILFL